MFRSRLLIGVLVLSMLGSVPLSARGADGPQRATATAAGPQICTTGEALTAEEMAQYSQLQAQAQPSGVLTQQKGGIDNLGWALIGTLGFLVIVGGLIAGSQIS